MILFTPYLKCRWTPCGITYQPYIAHNGSGAAVYVQADRAGLWWAWQGATVLAKAKTGRQAAEQAFDILRRRPCNSKKPNPHP